MKRLPCLSRHIPNGPLSRACVPWALTYPDDPLPIQVETAVCAKPEAHKEMTIKQIFGFSIAPINLLITVPRREEGCPRDGSGICLFSKIDSIPKRRVPKEGK